MIEQDIREKVKEIYEVLPKLNDRRCGYRTCGEFARAVVKGEASCYGCVSGGYTVAGKICNIMGKKVGDEEKVPSEYYNKAIGFVDKFGRGGGYNYHSTIHQNQRIMDAGQERAMLKQQKDSIRKQLDDIEERISKLKKSERK